MIAIALPKRRTARLFFIFLLTAGCYFVSFSCPPNNFLKMADGIVIYPDSSQAGNTKAVKLQVISATIIRVIASPARDLQEIKSLMTGYSGLSMPKWSVEEGDKLVVLKTDSVSASISTVTGAVSFKDFRGNPLVTEKSHDGRLFTPAVFDGELFYHICQVFKTRPGESLYGLGQHQDGILNNNHRQVNLFQNNSEIAIPFLLSDKHYGILLDNYSLTSMGDIRPFLPLSRLKLFSKEGVEGFLTGSFINSQQGQEKILLSRPESSVNLVYLNDDRQFFPKGFNAAKGTYILEGSIASSFTGMHQFKFIYGGYIKVWFNGKELLDRWRQAWNPANAVLDLSLEKNQKYSFRIEWKPDGDESYLSATWLNPASPEMQNDYTFSSEAGKQLDYYLVYGNSMDAIIKGYRLLTGKATMIPRWAMGLWQSRERYKSETELLNTVTEFRKRKIPLDNIVLDWSYWKINAWGSQEFDPAFFPSPDSMIDQIHRDHCHFMISVWPKFYEGIPAYKMFNDKGWLYKRNVADRQQDWKGYVSTFYDAFNPAARKGFWDLINEKLYKKGVDAFWMDASEPDILGNASPERRKEQMTPTALGPAAAYLNAYPLENTKGIYEGQRAADPDKRVFILTRSAYAGSQHYGAAVWSGDIAARWSDMKNQITAGINFSLSGIPFWTMDIGGFAVEHRYEHAQGEDLEEWREQMTRWYQFGAFCPLFRVHGQFPFREIYNVAPEDHPAYQSMLYYDKLRYRLMPYLYTLNGMTYHNDYTIMRGLVMDFAEDSVAGQISDQYMLGPSLLINPVYTFKARSREVYLPSGQGWYEFYSGAYVNGGQKITADAPYGRMPMYVKEGSIIPFGPELQYTAEKPADPVSLFVYGGRDASFSLYEDENGNYNYEKGVFANIPFRYDESAKTLTIGKREGSFPGMLKSRTFRIMLITKGKPAGLDFESARALTVQYNGNKKIIKLK
jgi:alpha-D-xyloside xylohydrolase